MIKHIFLISLFPDQIIFFGKREYCFFYVGMYNLNLGVGLEFISGLGVMTGLVFMNFEWYCDGLTGLFNLESHSDYMEAMAEPDLDELCTMRRQ